MNLTKTWLAPNILNSQLGLHGFLIYRLDRNYFNSLLPRVDGVLIAVKPAININVNNVELVLVRLSFMSTNLLIGVVYLPLSATFPVIEVLSC